MAFSKTFLLSLNAEYQNIASPAGIPDFAAQRITMTDSKPKKRSIFRNIHKDFTVKILKKRIGNEFFMN